MVETKYNARDYLYMSVITTLVLLFFSKVFLRGSSLFGSDFALQFYPWKKFIYDRVHTTGSIPFWNPYLFSGTPFIANIQASIFYPLGFLYYLLPPEPAYLYSTVIHFALGGIFMFSMMRAMSVSPEGSFLSAIVFTFNGYVLAHLYAGHLTLIQSYIWIPLVFLFLYRFLEDTRLTHAAGAGLVLGIQILGGFPQIAFYTILGSFIFGLFYLVSFLLNHHYGDSLRVCAGIAVFLFIGFALAAVQVLPTLEFTKYSTRAGGVSYAMATYDSLHPKELLSFLIPGLFGSATDNTYWPSQNMWHSWESCGYVGVFPLLLLFIKNKDRGKRTLAGFCVTMIFLSLFLALGKYNPLYHVLYNLPGFHSFRVPAQIIFLYVFAVAVLSGTGLDGILEKKWKFRKGFLPFLILAGGVLCIFVIGLHVYRFQFFFNLFRWLGEAPLTHVDLGKLYVRMRSSIDTSFILFFSSFLLLMLRKRRWLNRGLLFILVWGIAIFDLYMFGSQFIVPGTRIESPEKVAVVSRLPRTAPHGRVVTLGTLFDTNDGLRYGFPSILGYDPLILRRYVHYVLSSQDLPPNDHVVNLGYVKKPRARLLQLLHLRQVVVGDRIELLDKSMPYARVVGGRVVKKEGEVLRYMKNEHFDPHTTVVFEPKWAAMLPPQKIGGPISSSCSILEYRDESITIKASSDRPGYLVLSEVFYPGWKATVDGKKRAVVQGNYLFRVIPVGSGTHKIHLYFISWPFRIGAVISVLTLLICLLLIAGKRRKHKYGDEVLLK